MTAPDERSEPTRTPLHAAIVGVFRDMLQDVYTALPGAIESYDAVKGRAKVKPQIQEVQDSTGKYKPLPVVPGVPVIFPGGAAASLTMPLAKGDTGLLIFTKHALEVWLSRGGDVAPGDPRLFDLTDAVFLPGLRPFSQGSPAEGANALTLKNGDAKLKMEGGKLAIGNPSLPIIPVPLATPPLTGKVELLNLFDALLAQLATVFVAGTPAVISPGFTAAIQEIKTNLAQIKGDL